MYDLSPDERFEQASGAIDAMAPLLLAPPYVTLSSAAELIELAISFGAPLYNDGEHRRCRDLYQHTARILLQAAARQPTPSGRKTLAMLDDLERALTRSQRRDRHDEAAWALRHAFDKALLTRELSMETLARMMTLGEQAFARSDYGGSADILAAAIELAPELWTSPELVEGTCVQTAHLAYLYYGHVLLLEARDDEAAHILSYAITHIPCMSELEFNLFELATHGAEFQRALARLEDPSAHDKTPSHVATLLRSYLLIFSDQRAAAADLLGLHLLSHPDDEAAQVLLAMTPRGLRH